MSGYYPPITKVNVSQQLAPAPSLLQQTGALVSQGATTLTPGSYSLLTSSGSLTSLLAGHVAITSMTWATGVVTMVVPTETYTVGDTFEITVTGATPAAYNGTYLATVVSATSLTFPLVSNPGTNTVPGFYTLEDVSELTEMNTTFFAQGSGVSVYVLELGVGNAVDGIAALTAFITANPGFFYSYLLPHDWGVASTFYSAFAKNYTSTSAKVYFHVTTTLAFWQANEALFAPTLKSVIVTIEAPAVATAWTNGTPDRVQRRSRVLRHVEPQPVVEQPGHAGRVLLLVWRDGLPDVWQLDAVRPVVHREHQHHRHRRRGRDL